VNVVAIIWVAVITVIFSLPPNELVLWTFLLLSGALALYWVAYARHRFTGPTPLDEAELRRIEQELAQLTEGKPEVASA
jgi:membrane protein implicated in regulation of membrane protease activity